MYIYKYLVDNIKYIGRENISNMNSLCIKNNNIKIIDYLLKKIENSGIEEIYYSSNKFKIYNNIIIHNKGNNISDFYNLICNIFVQMVIEFYEKKLIKEIINFNYFYFEEYEKNKIFENCINILETIEKEDNNKKEKLIYDETLKYIKENKAMILDGFIRFRLKEYIKYIDNIVDDGVNKYIIDKEYTEFINLLKVYIESKDSEIDLIHLIYINRESILLDKNKNFISITENIFNEKYLSDISFSSNDFALNTLLTLLPKKIEIHLIEKEDEFINTLKSIFEGRIQVCSDCNICRTYKILNTTTLMK